MNRKRYFKNTYSSTRRKKNPFSLCNCTKVHGKMWWNLLCFYSLASAIHSFRLFSFLLLVRFSYSFLSLFFFCIQLFENCCFFFFFCFIFIQYTKQQLSMLQIWRSTNADTTKNESSYDKMPFFALLYATSI